MPRESAGTPFCCNQCGMSWLENDFGDVISPIKNEDPKGVEGEKKTPLQLLPPVFMAATAWVLKLGAKKYGPWNWRHNKVECQTYVGAIRRHLDAWQEGEDVDPESGQSHLAHIAASVAILLDAEANGTLADNRPPKKNKTSLDVKH